MRPSFPLRSALLSAALTPALLLGTPAAAGGPAPVDVLPTDPFADDPDLTFQQTYALREAEARALGNPAVYAQPYVDRTGALYIPVVTAQAQGEAVQPIAVPPASQAPEEGTDDPSAVPPPHAEHPKDGAQPLGTTVDEPPKDPAQPRALVAEGALEWIPKTTVVSHTWARLQDISDEIVELAPAELPDADKIHSAGLDPESGRVIVETTAATGALRTALAARYGSDVVALLVIDDPGPTEPMARHNDTSPFFGGASFTTRVGACTTGFAWRDGNTHGMLTAGHCTVWDVPAFSGGGQRIGQVTYDNYDNAKGSIKVRGRYRGDLALIDVMRGLSSLARIYVGNSNSGNWRVVESMVTRRTKKNDKFCVGGAFGGELCGWTVNRLRMNVKYSGGAVARNVLRAAKTGKCVRAGDSGAPVYVHNSRGNIIAKGILTGGGGNGNVFTPCRAYVTDIWDAHEGIAGTVAKG
ncbi:hypothetical protein [Nonomuraea sp. NPDC050540]|uniref:hypothetical protein n=1 Tax=Nonomuraea sp. NPDC050540 TaxID=3364367 RepID=UPI00378C807B